MSSTQQERSTRVFHMLLCLAITTSSVSDSKPIAFYSNNTFINKIEGIRILPVLKIRQVIALDVDVRREHIYFSVTERDKKAIQRISLNGDGLKDIISENIGICEGLAIEWRSRLLYWTDTSNKWIQVSWLDGSHRKVLIARDLREPRGIAVDPSNGFMFWTDWKASRIERADLDGHNRKAVVTTDIIWPNNIVIDNAGKRLYWTDGNLSRVDSSDFIGRNRKTIYEDKRLHPFGISLVHDLVYWSDWSSRAIHIVNVTNGLLQGNYYDYYRPGQPTMGVVVFDRSRQQPGTSPCERRNGNCEFLCILNPYGHRCVCEISQFTENERECKTVRCPKLKSPVHGTMFACATKPKSTCRFSCRTGEGFVLRGSRTRTCLPNGTWTGSLTYCKDVLAPRLQCPANILTNTPPGLAVATVSWVVPRPSDDGGDTSLSTLYPYGGIKPPHTFSIGQNTVTYLAKNKSGRKSYCFFKITVKDNEPPKVRSCPKDVNIVSETDLTTVVLPDVRFTDNHKVERVQALVQNGSDITWGTYDAVFTASDPSGNKAVCAFKLRIFSKKCKIKPPINGRKFCDSTTNGGMTCTIKCKSGFSFMDPVLDKYICSATGKWENVKYMNGEPKLPDCSRIFHPHKMKLDGQVLYQVDDCRNSLALGGNDVYIIDDFKQNLQFCIGDKCTVENASLNCGVSKTRRQITSETLFVTFAVFMKLEPSKNLSTLNVFADNIISKIEESLNSGDLDIIMGIQRLQADRKQGLRVVRKEPVCCDGQMFRNGICINCPPGYFYNKMNSTCISCPPDTFQHREGQRTCLPCPGKRSTWKMYGARSITDCRECKDKERETRLHLCKSWLESVKADYCNRDREIMYKLCPKSCGVCGVKSVLPRPVAREDDYTTATTVIIPVLLVAIGVCIVIARFLYVRRRERIKNSVPKKTNSREVVDKEYSNHDDNEEEDTTVPADDAERKTTTQSTSSQTDMGSSLIQLRNIRDGGGQHYKSADAAFPSARNTKITSKFCESCEATLV